MEPARNPAEDLRQRELRVRLLIDSIKDYAIFMLDPQGVVITWNPGAQQIKGYTADEIIGRHFSEFYSAEEIAARKPEMELEIARETGRFEEEGWRLRKGGARFWANVVISAVRDGNGQLVGFAKVTRDLTERRIAAEERAARMAAEQASRAKDEFLAMLGHELRNPLAPIMTAIQLAQLRGVQLPELEVIARQSRHLLRLVDDLLDVSRITRGKVELRIERVEMASVVAQALEMTSPLLEERHHMVTLDVPQRGCPVMADRARLTQVLCNLLTNAAKYSPPQGHVTIAVRTVGDKVRLRVLDDGAGIEPQVLARIFEPFVQAGQPQDRAPGGLGLGLAIVQNLVQLHGGTVTARSEGLGKGSQFEIDLPLAPAGEAEAGAPGAGARPQQQRGAAARKVLIVDDNQDAADLLAEILSALGHAVEVAHDGASALRVARTFMPDIALLDIGLPVMDGYELARQLRAEPWAGGLRLVALTGYGQAAHRERSRAAGFDEHLVKPIDIGTVERIVAVRAAR